MEALKCCNCNSELKYDFEEKKIKCSFCGAVCEDEEGRIDKTLKPEKILTFEITLDEAKEKVKEYFANSAYEYENEINNNLQEIYLPYWMYDCTCEAEYEYYLGTKHRRKHYFRESKIEYQGLLANASKKIDTKLTDKVDGYFDLSKLNELDSLYKDKITSETDGIALICIYSKLIEKLKKHKIL